MSGAPAIGALAEAIRFLTALPLPGRSSGDPRQLAAAVGAFRAVGLLVGGIGMATGLGEWMWGGAPCTRSPLSCAARWSPLDFTWTE